MKAAINSDEQETVARIEDNRMRREAFNAGYGFRKAIETKGNK